MIYARRRGIVGVLCAAAALAAPVAAQAGTTGVATAIKAQDKLIKGTPAYQAVQHFQANSKAQAKALRSKLSTVEGGLTHAITVVDGASATTSAQRQGQRDWVAGTRQDAHGVSKLEAGVTELLAGKGSAAKTAFAEGVKALKAGNLQEAKGDKLLGLPTTD